MTEKSTFNRIENDKFNLNNDESDYNDLNNKLQEIRSIISLLEKKILS